MEVLGEGAKPFPLGRPAKEGREESLPFPNSDWGEELDSSLQTCLSQTRKAGGGGEETLPHSNSGWREE